MESGAQPGEVVLPDLPRMSLQLEGYYPVQSSIRGAYHKLQIRPKRKFLGKRKFLDRMIEVRAQKKLSAVAAWENSKKASLEAKLKKIEEQLERKKAEYAEKMKNKVALVHKEAEEKRAMVEARRGEDVLKAEEIAAKYRATGTTPKKLLGCF
ncbi:hypothetical protein CUMW_064630 [Citrus unshiu]|nr:hypothetical protein CUMW_064630 [Citrus unshiu]